MKNKEIFKITSYQTEVLFQGNKLKSAIEKENSSIAVRVIKNNKLGFASGIGIKDEKKIIKQAEENSLFGEITQFDFPSNNSFIKLNTYDIDTANLSLSKMTEIGKEILEPIKAKYNKSNINIKINKAICLSEITNTSKLKASSKNTFFTAVCELEKMEQNDILLVYDYIVDYKEKNEHKKIAKEIFRKLQLSEKIVKLSCKNIPVIFTPEAVSILTLPLLQGLNGKAIAQKISPMFDKLGKKIFDEKLSLCDNPHIDKKPASMGFDDEGVPTKKNILIEKGKIKNFYFDLKTAAFCKEKSTGNGKRSSITSIPSPEIHNLIFKSGNNSLKEMIGSIKNGLIVDTVLGLGQGNTISGAFSTPLDLGFKIENGEIIGRVKEVFISGNIYDLLKNIFCISKEKKWVNGNCLFPYVLLENVSVIEK
ncbi:MAG: metallopeptidase TldD-related protein [bacterium]